MAASEKSQRTGLGRRNKPLSLTIIQRKSEKDMLHLEPKSSDYSAIEDVVHKRQWKRYCQQDWKKLFE